MVFDAHISGQLVASAFALFHRMMFTNCKCLRSDGW